MDTRLKALCRNLHAQSSRFGNFHLLRTGDTFRELKLPNLPSVELPANSGDGKITNVDSTSAVRWEKDGSLVVEIETTKSRAEDVITATRTIVLGFDQRDRVKMLKSTQKVKTEKD